MSPEDGATYAAVAAAAIAAATAAPQQPSGPLKPTAKGTDPSETVIFHEMAQRCMSFDISGPMSDMSDGTTTNDHVANSSLPAFLLQVSTAPGILGVAAGILPQPTIGPAEGRKLVVVPATADGFRGAVSALRSLDGESGVTFHTYSLPEDRCVRLLIKNLGRRMPENVVLGELRSLDIHVQAVMQLRSDQDRPSTPT